MSKELADRVVALGVGDKAYSGYNSPDKVTPTSDAETFTSDWRVCLSISLVCILFSVWIVFAIFTEVSAANPVYETRPLYPKIPRCDKELWLRIKDGCDE
jgi:hypothetical protein